MRFSVASSDGSGETDIYLAREIWEGMCRDGAYRRDDAHSRDESHRPGTGRLEVLLPGYGLC